MTPKQKDRIRRAVVELGAALTDVGKDFYIDHRSIECTRAESDRREYGHIVKVVLKTEEVIT